MKQTDFTGSATNAHEDELIKQLDKDVNKRMKDGIPEEVSSLASKLITAAKQGQSNAQNSGDVASIFSTQKNTPAPFFGEFELLAAAAEESDRLWYEQTITVTAPEGKGSYSIELVPFLGDESQVSITVEGIESSENSIKSILSDYSSQTVGMAIFCDNTLLLEAEVSISEDASFAEGTGKILQIERPQSSRLQIRIQTDED